jgi:hypothetical protein
MLPKTVLLYGKDVPLPERISLRAGPLNMIYENGDLRYIKYGDREVIRRIYVAIRDRNWGTTPPKFSNIQIEIGEQAFHIAYDVENRQGEIDFTWRGEITGEPDGTLRFSMDGLANTTFWRNRIGFCILHPAFLSGAQCEVLHVDGSREIASLPTIISADQPVKPFENMSGMDHEIVPGVWAEVRYGGDIFEMEDQRNWTDASFKTFCTPLNLPYPVEVQAGTRVSQAITLCIRDERGVPGPGDSRTAEPQPLTFGLGESGSALPLPPLGLGLASHGLPLNETELERLKALHLSHLRVELDLTGDGYPQALRRAWEEAKELDLPLEAALLISPEGEAELQRLRQLLDEVQPSFLRWLVYPAKELFWGGSPVAEVIALAHKYLDDYGSGVQFYGGTNTDFIFMKRSAPPLGQVDGYTFAIIAEVHAFDEASIVETLEAQPMVVVSAQDLTAGKPVIVSPVTFKMRHNPYATGPWPVIKPGELPPMVEERQMSLFGAAWTLGSIKALAGSRPDSLTYYETSGWRGVMETADGSPLPDKFRSLPGGVYPMYHVFADVGEFAGGEVLASQTSDNLRLEGLALSKNGQVRVLVANMTPEPQRVQICNLGPEVRCRVLDESSVVEAMRSPEKFRADAGDRLTTRAGILELELMPYAVARLDS